LICTCQSCAINITILFAFFRIEIPFCIQRTWREWRKRRKKCNFTFIGSYKALIFIKIAYAISQITFPRIFKNANLRLMTMQSSQFTDKIFIVMRGVDDGFIVNTRRICSVVCVFLWPFVDRHRLRWWTFLWLDFFVVYFVRIYWIFIKILCVSVRLLSEFFL